MIRQRIAALALMLLGCTGSSFAQTTTVSPRASAAESRRLLEIRSYNLRPGTRTQFQQLFVREALPMLQRWVIDVVGYGPSLHDADTFFLMRAFTSVEERDRIEDAFYGAAEWLNGPRDAVLSNILSYTTVVIAVDEQTLGGLRRSMSTTNTAASDLNTLTALNEDYVRSVLASDVRRFDALLAEDFLCSLPDGTLLDRKQFLEHTAKPATISNLAVHDVNVRLMGDFAIVHATTTFTLADGKKGDGRYTDVWARRNGQWLAVAAHVTRKPAS